MPAEPQQKPARTRVEVTTPTNCKAHVRVPVPQTAQAPGPTEQNREPRNKSTQQASPRKSTHWSKDVLISTWSQQHVLHTQKDKTRPLSPHTNSEQIEGPSVSLETETATGKMT